MSINFKDVTAPELHAGLATLGGTLARRGGFKGVE